MELRLNVAHGLALTGEAQRRPFCLMYRSTAAANVSCPKRLAEFNSVIVISANATPVHSADG